MDIKINSTEDLGNAIRTARKEQGATQKEFAAFVGVGTRFLSDLERGKETAEVGLVLKALNDAGLDVFVKKRDFYT